ncbi:MAG TPA: hypothetical protein VMZ29_16660 [Candidatus Bathyarchaeia archaeon]|nr:hypothetical protein [Candidatus Bathyarchaeia archaeon]
MSNDEDLDYEKEEEETSYKSSRKLSDRNRKILSYSIVFLIAFSFGCGIVGISLNAKENAPRKDLASTTKYLSSIISSFDISVYNSSTVDVVTEYSYIYNSTNTFENSGGEVDYIDDKANLEYMKIYFSPEASENLIQIITFHVNEKSQLNIMIFGDGREYYSNLQIKNDIEITFTLLLPAEIIVYVF